MPGSLAADLALALDPARLLLTAGLAPDPWQAAVLRTDARQVALNCCRQSGKSTVAAALGLHHALYAPGSLTLIVSPGERQSKLLYRKLLDLYRALGQPVPSDVENKLSLELANGSAVHALPGKDATIRGFSNVGLLLCDEAARVPDDTCAAVRPMLALSGGRLVLLSTPFGQRGFFFEAWARGGAAWHRTEVSADRVARISPQFLGEERLALGERAFRQEYGVEFLDPVGSVFAEAAVAAAADPGIRPLFPGGIRRVA